MSPTFVFVHGAFSNSLGWAPLQRELALRGHRTLGVDLPGHGYQLGWSTAYQAPQDPQALAAAPSTLAGVTLADNISHVSEVVRRAKEHGPVILVGHSRGGLTITGVGNAVPELIDRLVYISAWCCVDFPTSVYEQSPENATSKAGGLAAGLAGNPAELGALRFNFRSASPELLTAAREAMLADGTESELLAYLNTLDSDENLDVGGPDDRAQADTWGRIPRSFIRLTKDQSLPLALQDRWIREADALTPDNKFDVRSLDSSHVRFLIHPEQAADELAAIAQL